MGRCSGPWLVTVTRITMSSGPAFAYWTSTAKKRSSANTPVSSSSNSPTSLPRDAFSRRNCS